MNWDGEIWVMMRRALGLVIVGGVMAACVPQYGANSPHAAPFSEIETLLSPEAVARRDAALQTDFPNLSSVPERPADLPTAEDIAAERARLAADRAAGEARIAEERALEAERIARAEQARAAAAREAATREAEPAQKAASPQPAPSPAPEAEAVESGPPPRLRVMVETDGVPESSREALSVLALEAEIFDRALILRGRGAALDRVRAVLLDQGVPADRLSQIAPLAQQPAQRVDLFWQDQEGLTAE